MPWWNWATLATVPSHLLSSVFLLVPLKREKHLAYGRTPYISKAMSSSRQSGSAFPRLGFLHRTNRKEAEPINKVSGEPEQNEFYSPGLPVPSPVFSTGSGSLAAGMHKSTHVPLFQTPPTHPQPLLAPLFNLFPGFRSALKNELCPLSHGPRGFRPNLGRGPMWDTTLSFPEHSILKLLSLVKTQNSYKRC